MFGGETVSTLEVLARVLPGNFGKVFFDPSHMITQHNQVIVALLLRQSFFLVLVRVQVGLPRKEPTRCKYGVMSRSLWAG